MEQDALYRQYYEQEGIRSDAISAEARTPVTIAMIPRDISSILDVGCGDGTLLSGLTSIPRRAGIDISFRALRGCKAGSVLQGSADCLPFGDGVFDCILSTEMLEHLPDPVFRKACHELTRVTKRYIVISVPYHEDLNKKQVRCNRCGMHYHMHMHLRSFDSSSLETLFPGFQPVSRKTSGPAEVFFPRWILHIRQHIGGRYEWDPNALCPSCGWRNRKPPMRSAISTATTLLGAMLGKRYPKWISVLYIRK